MPASMISAPTGGRPKVIGSSVAAVGMVPIPGSTPTSVPTSAPIRHSRMLIGIGIEKPPPSQAGDHGVNWNTTWKPSARLENRSPITPSLNQETGPELHRQPQSVGKEETAERGQANADDDGFPPLGLRRSERGNQEGEEGGNHQTQRPYRDGKGKDRQRDEQRTAPMIRRQMLAFDKDAHQRYRGAETQQQYGEHARRGSGAEGKSVHALQVARCPQGKQRERHQRYSAEEILRSADPFRHDGLDRPLARHIIHRSPSP